MALRGAEGCSSFFSRRRLPYEKKHVQANVEAGPLILRPRLRRASVTPQGLASRLSLKHRCSPLLQVLHGVFHSVACKVGLLVHVAPLSDRAYAPGACGMDLLATLSFPTGPACGMGLLSQICKRKNGPRPGCHRPWPQQQVSEILLGYS